MFQFKLYRFKSFKILFILNIFKIFNDQDLEKANRNLEEGARKLRQEMEIGQEDLEKMADEYEKMRKVIGSSDKFSDDLQKQNAQLKLQVPIISLSLFHTRHKSS